MESSTTMIRPVQRRFESTQITTLLVFWTALPKETRPESVKRQSPLKEARSPFYSTHLHQLVKTLLVER